MHDIVVEFGLAWATVLLVACVVKLIGARSGLYRLLALDTFVAVSMVWLAVLALLTRSPFYLETVLVYALLAFTGTVAASRYYLGERLY